MNENITSDSVNEDVPADEVNPVVPITETVEYIEVSMDESAEIPMQEAFPPLGEDNPNLNHSLLYGRDSANQHPITAIEGLREELNEIEKLKKIYSTAKNHADYFMWWDENIEYIETQDEKAREGFFVSIYHDADRIKQDHIKICTNNENVFGVTVPTAGFIGNQNEVERNYKYGLVVYSGIVPVRCETTVTAGDYVAPNEHGMAEKATDRYGFYVFNISNIEGVDYAIISLSPSTVKEKEIAESVSDLETRMTGAEANIVAATNIANAAFEKASGFGGAIGGIEEQLDEMEDLINETVESVGAIGSEVSRLDVAIAHANEVAIGAISTAESVRGESVEMVAEALVRLGEIDETVARIETNMSEDSSMNTMLASHVDELGQNIAIIEQKADTNNAMIKNMVANFDRYIVANHSPRYGLTYLEAGEILEDGQIYIPLVDHKEVYDVYANNEEFEFEFSKGRYYTWQDGIWNEASSESVAFSQEYFAGSVNTPYWVVLRDDVIYNEQTYLADTLYLWRDNQWTPVALLNNSATASMIKQESDKLTLAVGNLSGSVGALQISVEDNESSISTIASHIIGDFTRIESWASLAEIDRVIGVIYYAKDDGLYYYYGDTNEDGVGDTWLSTDKSYEAGLTGTLATIQEHADDNGASISQIVSSVGENGEVNAASIVTAINGSESIVKIDADHVAITADDINLAASESFRAIVDGNGNVTPAAIVAAINGTDSSVSISADKLNLSGYVTVSSLGAGGTTTIDGSRITTGIIDANRINLTNYATHGEISSSISSILNGMELNVTNGGTSSSITLTVDGTTISSDSISMSGYVTIYDLSGEGTTTINGANIETGTLDVNTLKTSLYDGIVGVCFDNSVYVKDGGSVHATKLDYSTGMTDQSWIDLSSGIELHTWKSDGIQFDSSYGYNFYGSNPTVTLINGETYPLCNSADVNYFIEQYLVTHPGYAVFGGD